MDAEVIYVEQDETDSDSPVAPRYDNGRSIRPDGDDWPADEHTAPFDSLADQPNPFGVTTPDGLMTFDEAVSRAAAINNKAVAGHAIVRQGQRALPRGTSS
jgi:hypothetical protein